MRHPSQKSRKFRNSSGSSACDLCGEAAILVVHHIDGKDIPMPNHPSNIASICPNCHLKVHSGVVIIEGKFLTSKGYELIWKSVNDEHVTDRLAAVHIF
jgi:hypothetical protein